MSNNIPIFIHVYFSADSTCLQISDCGPEVNGTDFDEIEEVICQNNWHCIDNICRCPPAIGGFGGGFGGAPGGVPDGAPEEN